MICPSCRNWFDLSACPCCISGTWTLARHEDQFGTIWFGPDYVFTPTLVIHNNKELI